MKQKLTFILVAAGLLGVFAYSTYMNPIWVENALMEIEKEVEVSPYAKDLEPYLDEFIRQAADHDIDLNWVYGNSVHLCYTEAGFKKLLAVSWDMHNDHSVTVSVVRDQWNSVSEAKRKYIMFHELGHDILNLEHNECKIMNANLPLTPSWETVNNDINDMFKYYKNK